MKIICSSCKKIIDTEKHDFCPKCGSNFNYSENLKSGTRTEDYDEYERIRQESNIRMAEAEAERARNAHESAEQARTNAAEARKAAMRAETKRRHTANNNRHEGKKNTGCGCIGVIIAIFAVFGGIGSEMKENGKDFFEEVSGAFQSYIEEETEDYYTEEYVSESYIKIGLGEWIYDIDYGFCCDEVIPATDVLSAEGYMNLSFCLTVENCREDRQESYYSSIVKCYADGELCMTQVNPSNEYGMFLPGYLGWGQYHTGYVTFKVPVDAESVSLVYENTEVVIDNVYMYAEEWKAAVYGEEEAPTEDTDENYNAVGFDEYYISDEGYFFRCMDIQEKEIEFLPPAEGNMYVSFELELINDTDGYVYHFDYPVCRADGKDAALIAFSGDPLFIPGELEPYTSFTGYMCYEVPRDAETFEIIYRDEVKVIIDNPFKGE